MVEHAGLELIIQVDANLKCINKIINFAAVGLGNMHCEELMLISFFMEYAFRLDIYYILIKINLWYDNGMYFQCENLLSTKHTRYPVRINQNIYNQTCIYLLGELFLTEFV